MTKVYKIYIDIGHGGADPGAVSGAFVESEMNIATANAMAARLKARGFDVKTEQGVLTLAQSAAAANAYGADLLISVHYNAGGGYRGEVIYSIRDGSQALADAILKGLGAAGQTVLKKYTRLNAAGTADYLGILRLSKMPAALVEPCFIDSQTDRKLADTEEKQQNIGMCIADAVADAYLANQSEEDDMSEIVKQIAQEAGLSEADTIAALGVAAKFANIKESDWEKKGAQYLVEQGLVTAPRDGREPVEFGELGVILKRLIEKNDRAG